jgi:serine/threonine protein kinase
MSNLPNTDASAAPPLEEHDALPAGTRFGELEVLRVLGVGGFGIVYLARDHSLDRDVALKEYMPGQLAARGPSAQVSVRSGSHMETFALGLRSFVNEARLLARFDHRSLVKVYRFWEANNTAYMVMPFLQGHTLREARRAMAHAPDEAWTRQTLNPLLEALELLHREAVYHRDIAPDNILLPHDGSQAVLLDFGAARRAIGDRTQTFTAILKPSYAPIEQYAESVSLRQGPWTDIYALGAVMHYLIKGVPPAPATARTMEDHCEALAKMALPGMSSTFLAAVDWALAVRPQDRPQSVAEFRDALDGKITPRTVFRHTTAAPLATDPSVRTAADPHNEKTALATELVASASTIDGPTVLLRPGHGQGTAATSAPIVVTASASVQAAPVPWSPPALPPVVANGAGDPTERFKSGAGGERPQSRNPNAKPELHPLAATGGATVSNQRDRLTTPVEGSTSRPGRGAWPVVVIPAVLLVLAAAAWWLSARPPEVTELSAANPPAAVSAQMSTPAVAVPTPPPVLTPAPKTTAEPLVAAPTPVATKPIEAISPPKSNPIPPMTAAASPKAAPPPVRPAEAAANSNQNDPAAPPWPPVPAEPTKPSAQAANDGASSPTEACGGRVFFALLQCIERQCNSPRFSSHSQCADVRARREHSTQDVYGGSR